MVNKEFVKDSKLKDILAYIKGINHSEQIRMMFFCSLNGLRCINFRCLQVKDVFNADGTAKDVIDLSCDKNKGKFSAKYYINNQFRRELENYFKYLTAKYGEKLDGNTYLFTSQKQNKPFNRVSICRIFSTIYQKFGIHGASHLGRHMFITKMINNGINPFLVKQLVNHRNIQTTQRYYNTNPVQLLNAVETAKI
ncbi:MAG: tyrosine-type recombinase/integrase [Alphaproteobacteria bacterium]|nr:tyrosine-type recombinase/integrase [Alphaproteobacteria bacterium]